MHQARHRTGGSVWSIRPRSLVALAVAAAGLAASIWLPGRNDAASASVAHPAFADDFTGAAGTPVDFTKWSLDGDASNGSLDGDGDAVVTELLRVRPSFHQNYGHAEARIEASRARGAWRAFSVLDQYGRPVPGRLQTLRGGIDPADGDNFHTYAIDWSPTAIVWSIDGHPSLRLLPASPPDGIGLVLDLAADGMSPVRMIIDFVHVSVYGRPGLNPTPSRPSVTPSSATPSSPAPTPPAPSHSASPSPTPTKTASPWKTFTNYAPGDLVTYRGVTYQVLEAHTSLPGWEPPVLPNLFRKI